MALKRYYNDNPLLDYKTTTLAPMDVNGYYDGNPLLE